MLDLRVPGAAVHRLDLANLGPAVGGEVDDEGGVRRLGDIGVLLGADDEDGEVGAVGVGDEPLVAVDHPLVTVRLCACVRISVGSEPATSGSVMAKHDHAVPSHSGRR